MKKTIETGYANKFFNANHTAVDQGDAVTMLDLVLSEEADFLPKHDGGLTKLVPKYLKRKNAKRLETWND